MSEETLRTPAALNQALIEAVPIAAAPITTAPIAAALIEEAAKKSSLVWLSAPAAQGRPVEPSRPVWHVWLAGAVAVVAGGGEQPLPPFATPGRVVEACFRSKDNGARLVAWLTQVDVLTPRSPEWEAAAAALHAERLNLPEGDPYLERWAAESTILRLKPLGAPLEQPGGSGAARPVATTATTVGSQPRMLGGLRRSAR